MTLATLVTYMSAERHKQVGYARASRRSLGCPFFSINTAYRRKPRNSFADGMLSGK